MKLLVLLVLKVGITPIKLLRILLFQKNTQNLNKTGYFMILVKS